MAKRTDLTTYAYRKQRARLLAESDVCHLCGHASADVMNHRTPVSRGGDKGVDDVFAYAWIRPPPLLDARVRPSVGPRAGW
ncbi:hypothetical protein PV721_39490 [Streptomyces sp. MB09-01]|uniref:hypothetical protein n=1 Tax=Streptomyces sp. MB09-01 TaxID=3028666 RepID=UPI0029BECCB3|nr:hypothetical protein [Streptomyces sp. MB09-01]MDX3540286.1 hypothetical protein [Streptomyces sp. MB09-01]